MCCWILFTVLYIFSLGLNFIGASLKKSIHLSLDAMGGDNAPEIIINGAAQSKIRHPNLNFSFFGNKNKLLPLINSLSELENSIIVHTDEIVDANEKPSIAVRKGKNSSMGMAIQSVKSGETDAIVSAGNTGIKTFKPGTQANILSKLCECCGPCPQPRPIIILKTMGQIWYPLLE